MFRNRLASVSGVAVVLWAACQSPSTRAGDQHGLPDGATCESAWIPTFGGAAGVDDFVAALAVFDDGSGGGPALYVGGDFSTAGGAPANCIARWDGAAWSNLGAGMNNWVRAIAVFDDGLGGGPALYAGGFFVASGGTLVLRIARWNLATGTWSPVGGGMNQDVHALVVFDDGLGGGPALYAGGEFTTAGGVSANRIAKWNGTTWSALGSGMNNPVRALAVFDDGLGGGPALYAGGLFSTAGGVAASRIARWNPATGTWSPLAEGTSSAVFTLTAIDDSPECEGGPALYAGGSFTTAGGVTVNRVARWNGMEWSALGGGVTAGEVRDLRAWDDRSGGGPVLYATGQFSSAGGVPANNIARWDGSRWTPLGSGLADVGRAMAIFDDDADGDLALFVGGFFTAAGGVPASRIAKRQLCPQALECHTADLNCDGIVDGSDLSVVLSAWGPCQCASGCAADFDGNGVIDGAELAVVLVNWG